MAPAERVRAELGPADAADAPAAALMCGGTRLVRIYCCRGAADYCGCDGQGDVHDCPGCPDCQGRQAQKEAAPLVQSEAA